MMYSNLCISFSCGFLKDFACPNFALNLDVNIVLLKGLFHENLPLCCYTLFKSSLFKDWTPFKGFLKY